MAQWRRAKAGPEVWWNPAIEEGEEEGERKINGKSKIDSASQTEDDGREERENDEDEGGEFGRCGSESKERSDFVEREDAFSMLEYIVGLGHWIRRTKFRLELWMESKMGWNYRRFFPTREEVHAIAESRSVNRDYRIQKSDRSKNILPKTRRRRGQRHANAIGDGTFQKNQKQQQQQPATTNKLKRPRQKLFHKEDFSLYGSVRDYLRTYQFGFIDEFNWERLHHFGRFAVLWPQHYSWQNSHVPRHPVLPPHQTTILSDDHHWEHQYGDHIATQTTNHYRQMPIPHHMNKPAKPHLHHQQQPPFTTTPKNNHHWSFQNNVQLNTKIDQQILQYLILQSWDRAVHDMSSSILIPTNQNKSTKRAKISPKTPVNHLSNMQTYSLYNQQNTRDKLLHLHRQHIIHLCSNLNIHLHDSILHIPSTSPINPTQQQLQSEQTFLCPSCHMSFSNAEQLQMHFFHNNNTDTDSQSSNNNNNKPELPISKKRKHSSSDHHRGCCWNLIDSHRRQLIHDVLHKETMNIIDNILRIVLWGAQQQVQNYVDSNDGAMPRTSINWYDVLGFLNNASCPPRPSSSSSSKQKPAFSNRPSSMDTPRLHRPHKKGNNNIDESLIHPSMPLNHVIMTEVMNRLVEHYGIMPK